MSYSTEVLADTPLLYLRLGDTSGTTMTDSSGNGLNGTYVNSPTLGVTGALVGSTDKAVTFAAASSQEASVPYTALFDAASFTVEAWVKTTGTGQVIFGRGNGSSGTIGYIGIDSGGHAFIQSRSNAGVSPNQNCVGASVINNGGWHHVVGTRNGTLLHIYVDGVLDDASSSGNAGTGVATSNDPMYVASRGGASPARLNGTVDECAYYTTALSATRIAAHYAAGTTSGVAVAGEAFAAAATMLDGTPRTAIRIAGEPFVSGATMLDGSGFPIIVAGEAFTAAATMLDGSPQIQLIIHGERFTSAATMLPGNVVGAAIDGEAFEAVGVMLDGYLVHATDTTNAMNGRTRGARATVTGTDPVAPLPPGRSYGTRVDKAIALRDPVMVGGRPT